MGIRQLINEILILIPDDYYKKKDISNRLEYIRQDSYYRAPECMYLCLDDIYLTIKIYILNFYEGHQKPDWVDDVAMKILEAREEFE